MAILPSESLQVVVGEYAYGVAKKSDERKMNIE